VRLEDVLAVTDALEAAGIGHWLGGGWGVDALVGRQTRPHSDLDVWVEARDTHDLFVALAGQGVDQIYPWPGDRPWNFVVHDGLHRRVDLHLYEDLGDGRLHYGSVMTPFVFAAEDLGGEGQIEGMTVSCERAQFSMRNHTGYEQRDSDRHDVALLCEHFSLEIPQEYR
jgi:lincosamide nucleotidyltransferase A/C/D/E